ncbi:MAG: DUF3810 domain-containing protein [Ruminococcaceae bacterium]|nr:DUF3810 domain-containing protein [Oscillospiraceae bacterium]
MKDQTTPKQSRRDNNKRLPLLCKLLYLGAAVSAILYFVFTKSAGFSDWFNANVSLWGRRLLSYLTVWIPFSLAEGLLLLIPVALVALILIAKRSYCDSWKNAGNFLLRLGSILCVVLILFVWNFAPGYYGTTLDRKLGLERRKVSAEELYKTSVLLVTELNQLSDELLFPGEKGSSVMPYSYGEMNRKLMDAYDRYTATHTFPDHFYSRVKPVMLSEPMSYTHITGVYTFFTGEANVNVNFPDYCIPYTAAHELAHQRGVAREDEANMIAFLVCMESDDPYIRYSALLNVYEYLASALYSADKELYQAVSGQLSDEIVQEEIAYSVFFDQYRENIAADISEATNNAYLQSQGAPEGTRSYNMVVDLTVAYYRDRLQ